MLESRLFVYNLKVYILTISQVSNSVRRNYIVFWQKTPQIHVFLHETPYPKSEDFKKLP